MSNHSSGRRRARHKGHVNPRRLVLLVLIVVLLVACLVAGVRLVAGAVRSGSFTAPLPLPTATASPAPTPAPTPEPTAVVSTVRFSASGDNLIHAPIYKQAAARAGDGENYNFDFCYQNVAPFYQDYDVNWINQESLANKTLEPSTYPCFSTPGEVDESLYNIGFRVFSLSNNHTYDKGAKGIRASLDFWDGMPEDVVTTGLWYGESDYGTIPLQTVNGVTIAYLAYTEMTNGIPQPANTEANVIYTSQTDVMQSQISAARTMADFVVVGVHWGIEYNHVATDAQKTLAQSLADWGADVIIGTHPHVIEDAAWLTAADGRTSFVAYSLGNFISTQDEVDRLIGAVMTLTLEKTVQPDGTVSTALVQPKLHPVITQYGSGRSNVCVYMFRDYTDELANSHGIRAKASFSRDIITSIAQKYISAEFLELD